MGTLGMSFQYLSEARELIPGTQGRLGGFELLRGSCSIFLKAAGRCTPKPTPPARYFQEGQQQEDCHAAGG